MRGRKSQIGEEAPREILCGVSALPGVVSLQTHPPIGRVSHVRLILLPLTAEEIDAKHFLKRPMFRSSSYAGHHARKRFFRLAAQPCGARPAKLVEVVGVEPTCP